MTCTTAARTLTQPPNASILAALAWLQTTDAPEPSVLLGLLQLVPVIVSERGVVAIIVVVALPRLAVLVACAGTGAAAVTAAPCRQQAGWAGWAGRGAGMQRSLALLPSTAAPVPSHLPMRTMGVP